MNGNGKVSGVKMVRTEMGEPDAKGRRRAEIVAGSEHIVPADAVIMGVCFRPHNMEWLAKHSVELDSQGRIIAPEGSDNAFQTSNPKIFAGGDIVRGSDLVVTAIAEGRKAADRYYELAGSLSEVTMNSPDCVWRIKLLTKCALFSGKCGMSV
ncbi:glutamate synthase (NADPH) small subunit [Escherichia coli]|uniref:Glutamate synthase (NADPH) small subunit n=1 Tax=Escherichia coli TaxID=562 RepID=A0A377A766_ECOLX|nr:glutamate synthase (NADPH) small subunit [Escherichia coli]